jgi:formate hydrogenlyase subunit 4
MNLSFLFFSILNILVVVALSPFFMGLIKKIKAMSQRRTGPPLLQPYYSLWKLLKKETVYSSTSSWIMKITPYINIIVLLTASLFVPLAFIPLEGVDSIGNVILFIYLLALAKFFMALSGLDAGSTFGGMGSSREMSITAVFEPTIIVVFAALSFTFKTMDIHKMFLASSTHVGLSPALILLAVALFIVLIVETARVPVDNPETHLELTMIHEAMILEQSGKNLALMELSHAMKQTLLMAVMINIIFPFGLTTELTAGAICISILFFLLKGAVVSIIIALFESSFAKFRFFRLPDFFMIAFFLSIITILLEVFA